MKIRFLALGAVLGLIIAAAPSCGGKTCSPTNCAGCCGTDGKCVTTPANATNTTCGGAGNLCTNCTTTGATCSASLVCVGGSGTGGGTGGAGGGSAGCSPTTCVSGCCNGSVCVPQSSQTRASCGSAGAVCAMCTTGQTCNSGVCGAAGAAVGDPCSTDAECSGLGGSFKCKKMTTSGNGTYKNGYCTKTCAAAADCPTATSSCIGLQPQYGEADRICWKNCSASTDCQGGDGYACYMLTNGSACWISPLPAVDAGPPADKIGNACTATSQCANPPDPSLAFCIPEIVALSDGGMPNTGYTGGYCSANCTSADICGPNGICFTDYLGTGTDGCAAKCTSPWAGQSTCRSGYVCGGYRLVAADGGSMPAPDGVCDPSCLNPVNACATTAYCDAGYCLAK